MHVAVMGRRGRWGGGEESKAEAVRVDGLVARRMLSRRRDDAVAIPSGYA